MNRIYSAFPHLAAFALVTTPASALILLDEDFQTPAIAPNTASPGFAGWTYNGGSAVKSRTESSADLPGDNTLAPGTNQALQLEWTSGQANYNLSHAWSSSDVYTLTLNAAPQAWNIHQQRYIRPQLYQTNGTLLWDPGETSATAMQAYGPSGTYAWNGPGPYGNSDWQSEPLTQFSFTIDASTFAAGTEGENIYLKLASSGEQRGMYFDNVTLSLAAIPEPSKFALIGLGVLGLIMRRRR